MSVAQVVALAIFVAMFVMVVWDKIERQYVTLGCGLLTLIFVFGVAMKSPGAAWETLNFGSIFRLDFWYAAGGEASESAGVNWATIIFLLGMMIMVEGMARTGFFRWLCMVFAKAVNYKPIPLFVAFMIMSAGLAMFIDSITVILFLAAVTVELAQLLKIDPIPMILSEIFCANLGGSATMCGDPPNIIIGTALGLSFGQFVVNTGLIALISLIVVVVYYFLVFRKELVAEERQTVDVSKMPKPKEAIVDRKGFFVSCAIFACAVVLLVTHAQTGLSVAFIGTFIAIVTLIAGAKHIPEIMKRVDFKTLLFFIGLFIVVGGLEQTGVLEVIAGLIGKMSGGNAYAMVAIIIWISAIASAFVDNIPFAATMVPVIRSLSVTMGMDVHTLAWTLAMGTDIGGSATPIGASANVVGTSVAAKSGYPISWKRYLKTSAPATVIVIAISMLIIFARYL